ncbi:uncharacterized protein LOC110722669 isoform X1 [Chenopodium quinoa]|uniref:uncharacterized protein LOC110722669 isoform X1 n=1 Tax=Chenopodium quinoa TaxID=63459 RepID=UPI000B77F784|nr:uncharacterized protein LOC110722669 isoform X1 [Chenopodium quinoa]
MAANCILSIHSNSTPTSLFPLTPSNSLQIPSSSFLKIRDNTKFNNGVFTTTIGMRRRKGGIVCGFLPVDPWAPTIDSQSIASQLFAFSLFPYLGFLYFITKSKSAPKLTVFGFYFLLAFVGATIPAGIYAKIHYGTSLSNVDWLHGGAESLLTLSNLFVVLGLRRALKKPIHSEENQSKEVSRLKEENPSS